MNTYVHITLIIIFFQGSSLGGADECYNSNTAKWIDRPVQVKPMSEISTNAQVFKMQMFTVSIIKTAPNHLSLLTVHLSYVTHLHSSNEALSLLISPSSAVATIRKRQGKYSPPHRI